MNDLSAVIEAFGPLDRYAVCPPGWVPKPEQANPVLDQLKEAEIRSIGRSAGGRDIIAIAFGKKEPIDATSDNLYSSIDGMPGPNLPTRIFPESFFGAKRRMKPVLAIQGGIHGGELTGTVAMINLCVIIETGKDIRGKAWPRLQALARDTRIAMIPWLNIDGVTRWPLPNPTETTSDLFQFCLQGIANDGTRYVYPDSKRVWPIPPATTRFMGSYFNDAGVNLQYDFCTVERQPETTAWMRYYLDERPDGVLIWHCNRGSMIGPAEYFVPPGCQVEQDRIGGAVRARLLDEGLNIDRSSNTLPGYGKPGLTQSGAVYHVCGATPIMCELPYGIKEYPFTCDQMIDIGLITIEETLAHAHRDGLRPYEMWPWVKRATETATPSRQTYPAHVRA